MLAYLGSLFFTPNIDRNTQLNNCLKDLGPLNGIIKKYNYFFECRVIKELTSFTGDRKLCVCGDNIILYSENGKYIFITEHEEQISIWNKNCDLIFEYNSLDKIFSMILPDDKVLLSSGENLFISDFNKSLTQLTQNTRLMMNVHLYERKIIVISYEKIRIFSLDGQLIHTIECDCTPYHILVTQNKIISRFYDLTLRIWSLDDYTEEILQSLMPSDYSISNLLPYRDKIICVNQHHLELWDLEQKTCKIISIDRRSNVVICEDKVIFVNETHIVFYIDNRLVSKIKIEIGTKFKNSYSDNISIILKLLPNNDLLIYDTVYQCLKVYDFDGHCKLNKRYCCFSN